MGEEKILYGPPVLTQDKGHPHCMLTAVLAGPLVVLSRLTGCMMISVFIEYGFTTLHLGATIGDGGKSARSGVSILPSFSSLLIKDMKLVISPKIGSFLDSISLPFCWCRV